MSIPMEMFSPSTVAVVGASTNPDKIGNIVLRNILQSGYRGKVFPINPNALEILGLKAYARISDVNEQVDQAIINIPAKSVLESLVECGDKGVKSVVVISAGFKEVGYDGAQLEKQCVDVCRKYGMRMLGPNVVGYIDTWTPINATFAPKMALKGTIGLASQSGALCTSILDWSRQAGIGFSMFISVGNKADLTESDMLEIMSADPETRVIVIYIESVVNGPRFLDVARRVTRKKPVVVLKSGVSEAGARAASSHTGALAGSDVAVETSFSQMGILRAHSLSELFDLAIALSSQPVPKGDRLAVVTNAGGPGVLTADAVETHGLKMASLTPRTITKLRENLSPEAAVNNPVDVVGDANIDRYSFALRTVLDDPNVDSMLALMSPVAVLPPEKLAELLVSVKKEGIDKPVLSVLIGGDTMQKAHDHLMAAGVPCFTFPEDGVQTVLGMTRYARILSLPTDEKIPGFMVDKDKVRMIIEEARKDDRASLLGYEAMAVVEAYGINVPATRLVMTSKQAAELAEEMGYPVALKVSSPQILHKTDVGGVKLNLNSPKQVEEAFTSIIDLVSSRFPEARIYGCDLQKMVKPGFELIMGSTRDLVFGPLIMFGLGGIFANFLKDVSFRLAPLSKRIVGEMISETKAYTILRGARGVKPYDIESIQNILLRLSQLVTDFPEITEVDINPVFAYPAGDGCIALDVKLIVSGKST
nr:acetate--CoA ligase family protein [Candidatus Njordarchaeota archaeon]